MQAIKMQKRSAEFWGLTEGQRAIDRLKEVLDKILHNSEKT